jgi:hypothetical protein
MRLAQPRGALSATECPVASPADLLPPPKPVRATPDELARPGSRPHRGCGHGPSASGEATGRHADGTAGFSRCGLVPEAPTTRSAAKPSCLRRSRPGSYGRLMVALLLGTAGRPSLEGRWCGLRASPACQLARSSSSGRRAQELPASAPPPPRLPSWRRELRRRQRASPPDPAGLMQSRAVVTSRGCTLARCQIRPTGYSLRRAR